MGDRPVPGSTAAARADANDALVAVGVLLVVAAVIELAGLWWGIGLLGIFLGLAGLLRAG